MCKELFCWTSGIATIKHRCVTHLYGSNSIHQMGIVLHKIINNCLFMV